MRFFPVVHHSSNMKFFLFSLTELLYYIIKLFFLLVPNFPTIQFCCGRSNYQFLGTNKRLYNSFRPLVGLSVCLSVCWSPHCFAPGNLAPGLSYNLFLSSHTPSTCKVFHCSSLSSFQESNYHRICSLLDW